MYGGLYLIFLEFHFPSMGQEFAEYLGDYRILLKKYGGSVINIPLSSPKGKFSAGFPLRGRRVVIYMLEDDAEIMDRLQEIERILKDVQSRIPDLEGLAVVTRDGLPIASALYTSTDEDRISAMTAASLSLSERVVIELERGAMEQVIITGSNGLVIIRDAGEHAVLVGIARVDAKLGLVLLDMKRAANKLSAMI